MLPNTNVLHRLEQIGQDLLHTDAEVIHLRAAGAPASEIICVRATGLARAERALDGTYDVDEHTVTLLRALEAVCESVDNLDLAIMAQARRHLLAARKDLQLALFLHLRRRQADLEPT